MTPNMQQAIKLLQLPSQELVTEIQNQLDSNIMLELDDESVSEDSSKILNELESKHSNKLAMELNFQKRSVIMNQNQSRLVIQMIWNQLTII